MKKIFLTLTFIFLLVAFYFQNQKSQARPSFKATSNTFTNKSLKKIASNTKAKRVQVSVSESTKKTVLNNLSQLSEIANCLNEEHNYCDKFDKEYRDNNYFLKNQTPMHTHIANELVQLKNISDQDPEFVGQISSDTLLPFLDLTDNRSPVLALELLFEKVLNTKDQNKIIERVIHNQGEAQWQLYKLLLSMSYLSSRQISTIADSIRAKMANTMFSNNDMQLINKLDSLMLPQQDFEDISKSLCLRVDELKLTSEFRERIYFASKIKCY